MSDDGLDDELRRRVAQHERTRRARATAQRIVAEQARQDEAERARRAAAADAARLGAAFDVFLRVALVALAVALIVVPSTRELLILLVLAAVDFLMRLI